MKEGDNEKATKANPKYRRISDRLKKIRKSLENMTTPGERK
jgi:hypothetical protein